MSAELNQFNFRNNSIFFLKKDLKKLIAILIIELCRPEAGAKLSMRCFNAEVWVSTKYH